MMEKTKSQTSSRYGFSWWIKNLLIAALAYMLLPGFVKSNAGYEWLIEGYAKGNLKVIKQYDNLNNDQKLEMKLGYDYAFIEMIRRMTPEDAVIYYPSRKDFTDKLQQSQITFSGNLCDKLSAVRFLYPRRVVIEAEREKTPWGKKISHVAVVNGHGLELLPYSVGPGAEISVLPMDSTKLNTQKPR